MRGRSVVGKIVVRVRNSKPLRIKVKASGRACRQVAWATLAVALTLALAAEARTSYFQAKGFSSLARSFGFRTAPGPAGVVRYPDDGGPYDERLGYARLGEIVERLRARGYQVVRQAEPSAELVRWMDLGGYAIYHEKSQAGLRIVDRRGRELFGREYPGAVYGDLDEIPPLVIESLRFIENREILRTKFPHRNPAVEWDRLALASFDLVWNSLVPSHDRTGGSTLATQLEKVRHSREGRTDGVADKAAQIASASARSYLDGVTTFDAQRRIFTDYVNSIPLAAIGGYGEVSGLGDGLWAWFGADFDETNALLFEVGEGRITGAGAQAYRRALTLLLALNKPSFYLVGRRDRLEQRVDSYLRVMARKGVISEELRDAALHVDSEQRSFAPERELPPLVARKPVDAVRVELLQDLGIDTLYELDRLDLEVRAALDGQAGDEATKRLVALHAPEGAAAAGVDQYPMLAGADPARVVYSFTLYERREDANLLRIQSDTWGSPLNINEGAKLELGSTAKLRTLVSYLAAVEEIHRRYGALDPRELRTVRPASDDLLTQWVIAQLQTAEDSSLETLLEAALLKTYSASPNERFFTGGGVHTFKNFDAKDNHRAMSVREAFQNSVNLVFIRMMRDVARYQMYQVPGVDPEILENADDPRRGKYLERFARAESATFLAAFYREREGLSFASSAEILVGKAKKNAQSMAAIHRYLWPRSEFVEFERFVRDRLPGQKLDQDLLVRLYDQCAPGAFDLQDRGFLAKVHPLELWLVRELALEPDASLLDLLEKAGPAIKESYRWLFTIDRKPALDQRIRIMMEYDAFDRIHDEWRRLGYPFERLTPSYATAIGSSGDRPAALAELVGVLLNDGVRRPSSRIEELRFAAGTPYEVVLRPRGGDAERVLAPQVAQAARREMVGVVEHGTGRRAAGAVVYADGSTATVGAKTGTGDNRFEEVDGRGRVIASRVVNRTGTFVFFVDDRFFGVVTAYVPGEEAAEYKFTSALPAQVFRSIAPSLRPLLEG